MTDFEKLVEEYLKLDKKTLAELLALKEIRERNKINEPYQPQPYIFPPWGVGDFPPYPSPTWPQIWYTTTTKTNLEN